MLLPELLPPGVAKDGPWPPVLAFAGAGAASARHAHHAMHLVLARRGDLRVTAGGRTRIGAGVLTAPDAPHAIDAAGRAIVLVFVDPESDVGARLAAGMTEPVRMIPAATRRALLDELGAGASPVATLRWGDRALARLAGVEAEKRTLHPRVRRVLRHLRELPARGDASLAALAVVAGLSEGRLVHAFRASVGIPLRLYVLWLKLQRAAAALAGGASLAAAAQDGGFADAAHMSRTFRRMFGMSPSALRAAAAAP